MTILYENNGYRIESLDKIELIKLRDPIIDQVYDNYSSFNTAGLNVKKDEAKNLNEKLSQLYSINLALFFEDRFIGWSDGTQSADNRYHMKNSGIILEYRGKGLYSLLLNQVLLQTKEQGFIELYSHHNTDNNTIIIAKLKKDFFISGFEILPKYGLTVQLSYCHSGDLKKMFEYRAGRKLDQAIKNRFQN
ncbi:hypothetical protein N9N67_10660 [Bacteriovoracaceae bacterium]|nr:hypothetical protein [Bacteriovoracaceae bacterium]